MIWFDFCFFPLLQQLKKIQYYYKFRLSLKKKILAGLKCIHWLRALSGLSAALCWYFNNALWKSQQGPQASNKIFWMLGQTEVIQLIPESWNIHVPSCVLSKTCEVSHVPLLSWLLPSVCVPVTSLGQDEKEKAKKSHQGSNTLIDTQ